MPSSPTSPPQRQPLGSSSAPSQGVLSPNHEAKVSQLRKHNLVSNSPFHKHKLSSSDASPSRPHVPRGRAPPSAFPSPRPKLDGQLEIDPHRIPDEQEFENFQQVKARYNAPRKSRGYKKLERASYVSSSPFKSAQDGGATPPAQTSPTKSASASPSGPRATKQPSRLAGLELTGSVAVPDEPKPKPEPEPVFSLAPTTVGPGRSSATSTSWKHLVRRAHVAPPRPRQAVSKRPEPSLSALQNRTGGETEPKHEDPSSRNINVQGSDRPRPISQAKPLPSPPSLNSEAACHTKKAAQANTEDEAPVRSSDACSHFPAEPQESFDDPQEPSIEPQTPAQPQAVPLDSQTLPIGQEDRVMESLSGHVQEDHFDSYFQHEASIAEGSPGADSVLDGSVIEDAIEDSLFEQSAFEHSVADTILKDSVVEDAVEDSVVADAVEDSFVGPAGMAEPLQTDVKSENGTSVPCQDADVPHVHHAAAPGSEARWPNSSNLGVTLEPTYPEDQTCVVLDVESSVDSGWEGPVPNRSVSGSPSRSMGELSRAEAEKPPGSPTSPTSPTSSTSPTAATSLTPPNSEIEELRELSSHDGVEEAPVANLEEEVDEHAPSVSRRAPRLSTGLSDMDTGLGLGLGWTLPDDLTTVEEVPSSPAPVLGPRLCTPSEQAEEIIRRRRMKRGLRAQARMSGSSDCDSQVSDAHSQKAPAPLPRDTTEDEQEILEAEEGASSDEQNSSNAECDKPSVAPATLSMAHEPEVAIPSPSPQATENMDQCASDQQFKFELGPGTGKLYVRVDSFTPPRNLPIPSQPTRFELLLNNGLEEVKARGEGRLVPGQAQAFMGQEFQLRQHKGLEFTLTLRIIKDAHLYPRSPAVTAPFCAPPESPRKKDKLISRIFGSPKKAKAKSPEPAPAPVAKVSPHELTRFLNREGDLARAHVAFDPLASQMLGKVTTLDLPMVEVLDPCLSLSASWGTWGTQSVDPLPSRHHQARGTLQVSMFFLPPVQGQLPNRLAECVEGMSLAEREGMDTVDGASPEWARKTLHLLNRYEQGALPLSTILSPPRRHVTLHD